MEGSKPTEFPAQTQKESHSGLGKEMKLKPEYIRPGYKGGDKLKGKVALVTGGDSGIGRSVCVHFAIEGADVALCYLPEEQNRRRRDKKAHREGRQKMLAAAW